MKKFSFVSLFSGCGGLDLGLIHAGFVPLVSVEIDAFARSSHEAMLADCGFNDVLSLSDIHELPPSVLMSKLGLKPGELDLLCGGPPCQSFSLIGKRGSLDDPRGQLLYKMAEFANALQPKAILIEQVKGLLSAKCKDNSRGGVLNGLMEMLKLAGYTAAYKLLRAADYGVPQLRDRLFIVAIRGKNAFEFPETTHCAGHDKSELALTKAKPEYVNVKMALSGLPKAVSKGEMPLISNHIDVTPQGDRTRIKGVPPGECLAR